METYGSYPLRLLHLIKTEVEQQAKQDGISVDQFIATAVTGNSERCAPQNSSPCAAPARKNLQIRRIEIPGTPLPLNKPHPKGWKVAQDSPVASSKFPFRKRRPLWPRLSLSRLATLPLSSAFAASRPQISALDHRYR